MNTDEAPWVVVSGATSGIGLATVEALVARQYRVVGLGRRFDALNALKSRLGDQFTAVEVDLADSRSVQNCLETLATLRIQLKAIISNAAECVYQSVLELSYERLARLMTVNVLGPIALARALIPRLCEGGTFIQLSSVTGRFLPGAKFSAYAATKAAMDVVVEGLRIELAPRRIRVCTVTPGLVDTPIYDKVDGFDAARRKITEQIPQWLRPEEVANAILFILEQPAHVTIPDLVITPTAQQR